MEDTGLTTEQVLQSVRSPAGAILRHHGRVIARIEPADEIDLEDELWMRQPEQIARGEEAREEFRQGKTRPHEEVWREILGDDSEPG